MGPDILSLLHDSIAPVNVVAVNSNSSGTLDYEGHDAGLNVIAVGGFSLSRGLTLEGLVVSYFLRNSMMYDTLMQMGRWFGYRPGYEDLCRIWMPREAEGWYAHVTESIEEFREELRRMEVAGATPEEFGLKVRSHPDTLIVTARNKMGSSQPFPVSIGLGEQFIETWLLRRAPADLEANRRAAVQFAQALRDLGHPPEAGEDMARGRLVKDVPFDAVTDFLGAFRNHPEFDRDRARPGPPVHRKSGRTTNSVGGTFSSPASARREPALARCATEASDSRSAASAAPMPAAALARSASRSHEFPQEASSRRGSTMTRSRRQRRPSGPNDPESPFSRCASDRSSFYIYWRSGTRMRI